MFTRDDLIKYGSLNNIIAKGMFDIQGDAVIPAALLFDWYKTLGQRLKLLVQEDERKAQMARDVAAIETKQLVKKKVKKK